MKPSDKKLLSVILIFFLGAIVYSNTFFCSFHFDDEPNVILNPAIRNFYDLQNIWSYYHSRFFTFLSLAFNYHFNGLNVFGYHLFNLVVHLLCAVLVWWLTLLTLSTPAMKDPACGGAGTKISQQSNLIALFAGLVFVSHPVQTEAVTYIWERSASLTALFYLASVCFYVKARLLCHSERTEESKGTLRSFVSLRMTNNYYYIGSLLTAVVAMFTKENSVTVPLMILFYEFTFLKTKGRMHWRCLVPFLLTLFIIPGTVLLSKSQTFQGLHGDLRVPGGFITPMHYFLTQLRAMFTYIRLAFVPVHQNLDYDYPLYKSIFQLPVLISLLFLMAIFNGTIRLFSKYRLISFFIFWFFVTLIIPESSFWAMGDLILEHRLYLPLAGYSIFLAGSVYYLWGKNSIKTMVMILSLIIAFNSFLTYQRNKVWENEFTLWNDAAQKSPHKARPFVNRGRFYDDHGDLTQALSDYNKAIEIDPDNAVYYYDRGIIYDKEGKVNQSLIEFTKAIMMDPNYVRAYVNRGVIYAHLGKPDLAIIEYSKAIEKDPNFLPAYNHRYQLYYQLKEYDKARADVQKIENLSGHNLGGYFEVFL